MFEEILNTVTIWGNIIWDWFGVEDNRDRSTAIATVVGTMFVFLGILWAFFKLCISPFLGKKVATEHSPTPMMQIPASGEVITLTSERLQERIEEQLQAAETKLTTAHGEEVALLQQQIQELTRRAQNPEAALAEAQDTIHKLEETLTREGNAEDISETRMAEAREALEAGDFSIAQDIFEEIKARDKLAVERSARASFALGEIAKQEIRWADAAEHFAIANKLSPNFKNSRNFWDLLWKTGKYSEALIEAKLMKEQALIEFGNESYEFGISLSCLGITNQLLNNFEDAAVYLEETIPLQEKLLGTKNAEIAKLKNNLATLYESMGRFVDAEPLYNQAIEIDKQTIGEKHPDYAIHLNNLAGLYIKMGLNGEAEPLNKKAIEINKEAIGEKHPDYAIQLNNLAILYKNMGRYEKAEPLCQQAIEILETTLGPDHPNTIRVKTNLAILQSSR